MFDGHYLLPEKIKSWLQKIICNITEKTECNIEGIKKIITRRNGPAMTLQIHCEKVIIDVDLVPVIEFPNWPSDASCSFLKYIPEKQRNCLMIPKPPSENICQSSRRLEFWRLHFPGVESILLTKDNSCIKSVIKLMKLLRDRQEWKSLVSYYIKTVVMHAIANSKDLNWNQDQAGHMFLNMLKKLDEYVCTKHLPHIMYPDFNLFHKISGKQLDNIHFKLKKIIDHISKERSALKIYLCSNK
ncbi:cyclic GMP-AMP synthase-like receptor [Centruroides vittatus]|uniref:cyclic GMP-AMP synthase-like receptor n=1 Tax=Centruroides vittatus TaxID=120091 RepID=UPI00350FBD32